MKSSAIAVLDEGLQTFRKRFSSTLEWEATQKMSDALALIRSRHQGAARSVDRERIMETVNDFLLSGDVLHQEDVFNLCLGAGWLDADGRGILADPELRGKLFTLAETLTGRAKRLKAFRNLLYAYWTFPLHDDATPQAAIEGWKELRDWLKERHTAFSRHPARKPGWFNALAPHRHLLAENPCAPYVPALLRGNFDEFDELQRAAESLRIPANSWLKAEAVLAPVNAALHWPDQTFREFLPALLKVATGNASIEVPAGVTQRAIARLLVRYARQECYEPHEALFVDALAIIGNPWQRRATWDARVCDEDGSPCSLAREMVSDWLKERLIGAFFAGNRQFKQSLELWQRYSVFMQEISLIANGQALLLRMGDLLVIVPKNRNQLIEAYSWQDFFADGGTRLLDGETVNGNEIHNILARRQPAIRAIQTFEETLKFLEFVISAKTRLQPDSRR